MEKSEPTLVPEWLKNSGSSNGGGSVSHLDDQTASRIARNKSVVNSNGHDFGWSSGSNTTTSSYFRRSSSSNGSANLRSYNSFGRNQQHDKEWTKDTHDRSKLVLGDHRHPNFSDSQGNILSRKFERDGLRRSQSMISDKCGDNNDLRTKGSPVSGVNKATFDRDFPSLGAEERAGHDIGRIPSPGLSSAIQSLHISTSAAMGGEKWTSALAEVPVLVGSDGIQSSKTVASGTTSSLNMAKAVAQGPSHAQTPPELFVGNQRLEQLAIKQSRQLIPVTPSMPKTLVVNTSDKHKAKAGQHQHPVLSPVTHSPRGGTMNSNNISKASSNMGKLHILNSVREKNGIAPMLKDTMSPTNGSKAVNSTNPATPSVSGPASRGPQNKPVLTVLEKRPTSQAKSRNEFFNSVRKKSMPNSSSDFDSATPNTSPVSDKLNETKVVLAINTGQASGAHLSKESYLTCNGDTYNNASNGKHPSSYSLRFPEEEETAFMRLLGWKEDSDEGSLTKEEINAYYTDIKTKLSTSIQNHP